jgi:cobalt-zinc-cadmium resistance protein CzcA
MIQRLVALALRVPLIVFAATLALVVAGSWAYAGLNVEAYPNPVPPMIEVVTQPNGLGAEEVERYVTVPLEVGLAGMPGIDHVRSQSLFGLSDIKIYFTWSTSYAAARQEVINRLAFVDLPKGVTPELAPANAVGEIFRYTLVGDGYDLRELKTAQDFVLERQLKQVPGVADVSGFGGETKQYQIGVDPFRLRGQGVTLVQLMTAVANANGNVGGQRLQIGEQSYDVRGVGLFQNVHDVEDVVVAESNGVPVRVKDVAVVKIGSAPRLGQVGHDDSPDVVQGIVLMRYGAESRPTLDGIRAKLAQIERENLLPPGMKVVPYYDRGALVKVTTHTVIENLAIGMALVALVLLLFLGNARAALITALNVPLALLAAFIGLAVTHTSANLISLGAVDFGIVVDSTVIVMENVFRHLGSHGKGSIRDRILAGAKEVAVPMAFSCLILGVAFLPLFTLTGVSGAIFGPMAQTYGCAIAAGVLLALTLTPVLTQRALPAETEEKDSFVMRMMNRLYARPAAGMIERPWRAAVLVVLVVGLAAGAFPFLGGEFMPKLEEGNVWVRATLPTSISLEQSTKYVGRMRDILRGCPEDPGTPCTEANRTVPEVVTVVSQVGRPDDGFDVAGFYNIELFAALKPTAEWRSGMTKDKLTEELSRKLGEAFPGVVFNFSQMIGDNVEEATSGVKGENSVKVVGPDLHQNEATALAIADAMEPVPGVKDLGVFRSLGQPSVKIVTDRAACARFGLNTGDVEQVVEAAIGGEAVTTVYEGEKKFDLVVRWLEPYRSSVEAIREITVATPEGAVVPLGQLATITIENGPAVIYREDGKRYVPLKFSVRGRDLTSTVDDSKRSIEKKVALPYGTHLEWGGAMTELDDALGRLSLTVPVSILLIALLAYGATRNLVDTGVVLLALPIACAGGVMALFVTGIPFSVSAAMGFISIFGIAVQDAILLVTYFQRARETCTLEEATRQAGEKRFRPALMTTLVAMLGLLPAAISNGIGAQTQKPLAVVVIGGSLMLALVSRLVVPPMLLLAHRAFDRHVEPLSIRPPLVD